jgi:hypothetical protein
MKKVWGQTLPEKKINFSVETGFGTGKVLTCSFVEDENTEKCTAAKSSLEAQDQLRQGSHPDPALRRSCTSPVFRPAVSEQSEAVFSFRNPLGSERHIQTAGTATGCPGTRYG